MIWSGAVELWGVFVVFFFFQAEDGIRDVAVTGVQTCALPISVVGPHHGLRGDGHGGNEAPAMRSEEHTSELQSRLHLVCRLLLEKKKFTPNPSTSQSLQAPSQSSNPTTLTMPDSARLAAQPPA